MNLSTEKLKVSVIIPTFNRSVELKRCLESLASQTYKNFEVIVCDDGSTDNTMEVTFEFSSRLDIKYSFENNSGGPAKPRNRGIKISSDDATIIAFLDSDDWWYPKKLEECVKYIKEYDLVYHDLDMYRSENKKVGVVKGRKMKNPILEDLLIFGNGIPNSSVLIKKSLINIVGDFDEDKRLIATEDADYWIRVSQYSNKFFYLNKSLGAYWIGNNISVNPMQVEKMIFLLNNYITLLPNKKAILAHAIQTFNNARTYHQLKLFRSAAVNYIKSFKSVTFSYKMKIIIGLILCSVRVKI